MADDILEENTEEGETENGSAPTKLPVIKPGKEFNNGALILNVLADNKDVSEEIKVIVKAGAEIKIIGKNLDKFDSVALRVLRQPRAPQNVQIYESKIIFNIANFDKELEVGGNIFISFHSLDNPQFDCRLSIILKYRSAKQQEEEDEEAKKKAEEAQRRAENINKGDSRNVADILAQATLGAGKDIISGVSGGIFDPALLTQMQDVISGKQAGNLKDLVDRAVKKGDLKSLQSALKNASDSGHKALLENAISSMPKSRAKAKEGTSEGAVVKAGTVQVRPSAQQNITDDYDEVGGAEISAKADAENIQKTQNISGTIKSAGTVSASKTGTINVSQGSTVKTGGQVNISGSTQSSARQTAGGRAQVTQKTSVQASSQGSVSAKPSSVQSRQTAETNVSGKVSSQTQAQTTSQEKNQASISGSGQEESREQIKASGERSAAAQADIKQKINISGTSGLGGGFKTTGGTIPTAGSLGINLKQTSDISAKIPASGLKDSEPGKVSLMEEDKAELSQKQPGGELSAEEKKEIEIKPKEEEKQSAEISVNEQTAEARPEEENLQVSAEAKETSRPEIKLSGDIKISQPTLNKPSKEGEEILLRIKNAKPVNLGRFAEPALGTDQKEQNLNQDIQEPAAVNQQSQRPRDNKIPRGSQAMGNMPGPQTESRGLGEGLTPEGRENLGGQTGGEDAETEQQQKEPSLSEGSPPQNPEPEPAEAPAETNAQDLANLGQELIKSQFKNTAKKLLVSGARTVGAVTLPYLLWIIGIFIALFLFFGFFIYVGCNAPFGKLPGAGYRASYVGAIYPEICQALDMASGGTAVKNSEGITPPLTSPSPPATSPINPR